MTDYLAQALAHIGATDSKVLAYSITDDEVVIVLDNGIKGCPKYRVALDALTVNLAGALIDAPIEPAIDPADIDAPASRIEARLQAIIDNTDLESLPYRELQTIAKDKGIPANQSKDALLAAITDEEE